MASEVRKLLNQIKHEYQASRNGLTGIALVARHDFIQKRTANLANAANQLVSLVGADRAAKLADLTMDVVDLELQLQEIPEAKEGGNAHVGH